MSAPVQLPGTSVFYTSTLLLFSFPLWLSLRIVRLPAVFVLCFIVYLMLLSLAFAPRVSLTYVSSVLVYWFLCSRSHKYCYETTRCRSNRTRVDALIVIMEIGNVRSLAMWVDSDEPASSHFCEICMEHKNQSELSNITEAGPNKEDMSRHVLHFYGIQVSIVSTRSRCRCAFFLFLSALTCTSEFFVGST